MAAGSQASYQLNPALPTVVLVLLVIRELHGNGDDRITAVSAVIPREWGLLFAVIPR